MPPGDDAVDDRQEQGSEIAIQRGKRNGGSLKMNSKIRTRRCRKRLMLFFLSL
jgi:hypothetical protein